jgi:hypothetical protein
VKKGNEMRVFAAFHSTPDYHGKGPSLKSLHYSLEGAIASLYPKMNYNFQKWPGKDVWEGPDGFGLIKLFEVKE